MQVQIDNDTFQYGHEYVGLNPIFQVPSFISVRIYRIIHSNNLNTQIYSLFHTFIQPYVIGGNPVLAFKMALK